MDSVLTITQIIAKAGGAGLVAERSVELGKDAVYKWKVIGIPDRHWPLLIELCLEQSSLVVTPQHLYEANRLARAPKARVAA